MYMLLYCLIHNIPMALMAIQIYQIGTNSEFVNVEVICSITKEASNAPTTTGDIASSLRFGGSAV
jgi:hypothetical protein